MSLFKQFKKKKVLKYQNEEFTLFEPSALDRTLHLQRVEKAGESEGLEFDDDGNTLLTLGLIKANIETSVDLISICLAPSYDDVTADELRADLLANGDKKLINALYEVAESLAYEKAPEDVVNPKQDPALDSATD